MLFYYQKILEALLEMDNTQTTMRQNGFALMYHYFHKGWRVREPIVFQIPNIRNKISYSKVRGRIV